MKTALLALVLAAAACAGQSPSDPPSSGSRAVLFVGNSLTYTNDLPGTLRDLAASVGDDIRVASVSLPNYAVIDHATGASNALPKIRSQHWDYVVLQQGPTSRAIDRDTLVLAAQMLDGPIRAAGGRPALMMVWPVRAEQDHFDAIRASFRAAACAVDGVFLPAGEAWRTAWRTDPSLALYGPDDFHPGPLGTYLAALVIYERITGHDARALPSTARVDGVRLTTAPETVRLLQRAAHETNAAEPAGCVATPEE